MKPVFAFVFLLYLLLSIMLSNRNGRGAKCTSSTQRYCKDMTATSCH